MYCFICSEWKHHFVVGSTSSFSSSSTVSREINTLSKGASPTVIINRESSLNWWSDLWKNNPFYILIILVSGWICFLIIGFTCGFVSTSHNRLKYTTINTATLMKTQPMVSNTCAMISTDLTKDRRDRSRSRSRSGNSSHHQHHRRSRSDSRSSEHRSSNHQHRRHRRD